MAKLKHTIGRILIPMLPLNRRTFDILRFEFGCIGQRLKNACSPVYHAKIRKLRSRRDLSLNLGSGGYGLPGWINIDARAGHKDIYIAYDIRRPLPFRDAQVKRIFAEHVIEHIDFRHDIPRVLKEFYRILQPGGIVRIIVPDAARFLSAYTHGSEKEFADLGWDIRKLPSDIYSPMHIVNHIFHQGGEHLFGWDYETMQFALARAGFEKVKQQSFRASDDPQLAIDRQQHAAYSLVIEATK